MDLKFLIEFACNASNRNEVFFFAFFKEHEDMSFVFASYQYVEHSFCERMKYILINRLAQLILII